MESACGILLTHFSLPIKSRHKWGKKHVTLGKEGSSTSLSIFSLYIPNFVLSISVISVDKNAALFLLRGGEKETKMLFLFSVGKMMCQERKQVWMGWRTMLTSKELWFLPAFYDFSLGKKEEGLGEENRVDLRKRRGPPRPSIETTTVRDHDRHPLWFVCFVVVLCTASDFLFSFFSDRAIQGSRVFSFVCLCFFWVWWGKGIPVLIRRGKTIRRQKASQQIQKHPANQRGGEKKYCRDNVEQIIIKKSTQILPSTFFPPSPSILLQLSSFPPPIYLFYK